MNEIEAVPSSGSQTAAGALREEGFDAELLTLGGVRERFRGRPGGAHEMLAVEDVGVGKSGEVSLDDAHARAAVRAR